MAPRRAQPVRSRVQAAARRVKTRAARGGRDFLSAALNFLSSASQSPALLACVVVSVFLLFRHVTATVEADVDWVGDQVQKVMQTGSEKNGLACKIWAHPKKTFGVLVSLLPLSTRFNRPEFVSFAVGTIAVVILAPTSTYFGYSALAAASFLYGAQRTPSNKRAAMLILLAAAYFVFIGHKTQSERDTAAERNRTC